MTLKNLSWHEPMSHVDIEGRPITVYMFDYYQRPFALLHAELKRAEYRTEVPHPIRKHFWRLLPYRQYAPTEARELMLKYLDCVEQEIAKIVSKHSLAYWLHLYRRLLPSPIGHDGQPATVASVRATLEAAIQKHSKVEPCQGVGITGEIPIERVLGGILMSPEFAAERNALETIKQLVLTDFTSIELREFYDVERLAYEIWQASALLRITAKGAHLVVGASEKCVFDIRSDDLRKLVRVFDNRNNHWDCWLLSSTGVVGDINTAVTEPAGVVLLPNYNVNNVAIDKFSSLFEILNVEFTTAPDMATNFIWAPMGLRKYREAHLPFSQAFVEKYGVDLDAALLVVSALCARVYKMWTEAKGSLVRFWQRAYEGPYTKDYVLSELKNFSFIGARWLGLDEEYISQVDLPKALRFWELDESIRLNMDLAYAGPHHIFLPYGKNRMFIDYAWISTRLFHLFVGVTIPDQNFKGDALETLVRADKSVLPVRGCKSLDGGMKQIDAAFEAGDRLVIVECRAAGKSIGFSRGNPDSILHRNKLIDKALEDIDKKAQWLAIHPTGTNYDVSRYKDILPIAVTPFVEYVPSSRQHYWLTDALPRILTPSELQEALENNSLAKVKANIVPIRYE